MAGPGSAVASAGRDTRGGILTVDLAALAANYRTLRDIAEPASVAAVVKADAYGLGVARAAPALAGAGCRTFFVTTLEEGIALRGILDEADIHVFNGAPRGGEGLLVESRLTPVLNSLEDIHAWLAAIAGHGARHADLQLDTGMSRQGLNAAEAEELTEDHNLLAALAIDVLISHLACADEPAHPLNRRQLERFNAMRSRIPARRASISASSGIFLGHDFHFDLARAGVALYGVNPTPGKPNPMAQVIRLQGKILQVRDVDTPETVGYGATHRVAAPRRIATVALGYADGYPWSLGNRGIAYVGEHRTPVVGRVSMDLISLDVTDVPPEQARPGAAADLIGPRNPIEEVAAAAGTIPYELLTRLGPRLDRVYLDGGARPS
jgi:alanine racemase